MLNKEEQNQEKEPIKDMNEHTASNEPEDQALQEELDTVEDGKKEGCSRRKSRRACRINFTRVNGKITDSIQ